MRLSVVLTLLLTSGGSVAVAESNTKSSPSFSPDKRPAISKTPNRSASPKIVRYTTQGVSRISNRTSGKVYYKFRWKMDSGWTTWRSYNLDSFKMRTHAWPGANQAQVRFDRYYNDAKYTGRTVDLPVTVAPLLRKPRDVDARKHAFYADGTILRVYKVDIAAERQAMRVKGVVLVSNPRRNGFNANRIPYQLRWRGPDRRWGRWKKHHVSNGRQITHWVKGATGCEIRFDRIGGDGKVTPKTYNLNFDTVPAWKTPTSRDARRYEFKYNSRSAVDLYRT